MKKRFLLAAALGVATMAFGPHAASAQGLTVTGTTTTDAWDVEPGQSIPTGTNGFVNATLNASTTGLYTFVFGPNALPGATGYGNAGFTNEFWVGTSRAAAEAAGDYFCNHGCAPLGLADSTVGQSFSYDMTATGAIPYGFTYFRQSSSRTILNGDSVSTIDATGAAVVDGAVIVETATSFGDLGPSFGANAGPNPQAYLGLSDENYLGGSGDHDFQDLTVMVYTPEPMSMALLGFGLVGLGAIRRRK